MQNAFTAGAFPVNTNEVCALHETELIPEHAGLRADGGAGMFAAAPAMAVAGSEKRQLHFKAHCAAKAAALNHARLRHGTISPDY